MRLLREVERIGRAHLEVPVTGPDKSRYILLASFPKSGSTWLRFMLANLCRIRGRYDLDVDFHTVDRYAPDIRKNRKLDGRIEIPALPLFLKTHFPWIRGFRPFRSAIVVRDPVDTLVSYHRHLTMAAGKRFPELSRFVRHWRYGAGAWRDWYRSWFGKADVIVQYEDLLSDPLREFGRLVAHLRLEVTHDVIVEAVERSSKGTMRRLQAERGVPNLRNPDFQFVDRARAGAGREVLDTDTYRYVRQRTADVAARYGYGEPE